MFLFAFGASTLGALGLEVSSWTPGVVLPAGISFYTFQTLCYTIDVYRRQIAPEDQPADFAAIGAFFQQLAAGSSEDGGRRDLLDGAGEDAHAGRIARTLAARKRLRPGHSPLPAM